MAGTNTSKRPRDDSSYFTPTESATVSSSLLYRWEGAEVPIDMKEATFPKETYRSRGRDIKTAVHWGQRKLLISEMQLLTYFCEAGKSYWIVYVGSAPGSHLLFLNKLYDNIHEWELVDPGAWDNRLLQDVKHDAQTRFHLRNEFFDNNAAYELAARRLQRAGHPALAAVYQYSVAEALGIRQATAERKVTDGSDAEAARTEEIPIQYEEPVVISASLNLLFRVSSERVKMLFVSDVRSGSEASVPGAFERHVFENTRAQEAWVDIVNPTFAMLKFRLPYTSITKYDHNLKRNVTVSSGLPSSSTHPDGTVLLPVWTRPTSTECRLVVPQYCKKREYDHQEFEDAMFFFNAFVRERVHFPHAVHGHTWVTHQYDGASEVRLLSTFVKGRHPEFTEEQIATRVLQLADDITDTIGGSFEKAVANRDAIHIGKGNRGGWIDETKRRLQVADDRRSMQLWKRNLVPTEFESSSPSAPLRCCDHLLPTKLELLS
jgi:cap3/cap4 methyltransferase